MIKALKVILIFIFTIMIVVSGVFMYVISITKGVNLDQNKLVNLQRTVSYCDNNGEILCEQVGDTKVTEFSDIPVHTINAFIAIEDKRFYTHNGVDYHGLIRATFNNIKSLSFKEGASTISQQLIKNTHLTNEKTLKRKLLEIKLALQLEKKYSKNEILEKYLNTIYFGDGCYGITAATKHYFDKSTKDLTLNESAALAGLIKAPSNYSPIANFDKCNSRKNLVLKEMLNQGYISETVYNLTINTPLVVNKNIEEKTCDYLSLVKADVENIVSLSPYSQTDITVNTTIDCKLQKFVEKKINDYSFIDSQKSIVVMDTLGKILAYSSTVGDVNRQIGSIIKPILVYAPAINENVVSPYTLIYDEKTNFNGYSPSNYADKYFGYISIKDSLAKSSNVCAVKILNSLGIDKALYYAKKFGLKFSDGDKSLALALGACKDGLKLTKITSAYNSFINGGNYYSPVCVNSITESQGTTIYKNKENKVKIFESDTASIMNDMLKNVVESGTAKKLSALDFDVYAKTGTVGLENGNSDAYTISYNGDYVVGVWFGSYDGELMDNSVSGGTLPCCVSFDVWQNLYKDKKETASITFDNGVTEVLIDKISYENDHTVFLADKIAPKRYVLSFLSRKSQVPNMQSNRFSSPKIDDYKSIVDYNGINIKLCQAEYINSLIYRIIDGKRDLVFDSKKSKCLEYLEKDILPGKIYQYSIVPYFENGEDIIKGKEILLEKIKSPSIMLGDEWWQNDFA